MVGLPVLLGDVQRAQLGLEVVAAAFAAGEPGGEHHPVISQGGGRNAISGNGSAEGGEHD
jgi:hypothetical protein